MKKSNRSDLILTMVFLLFLVAIAFQPSVSAEPGGTLAISGLGTLNLPDWLEAKAAKGLESQPNAGQQYDLVGLSKDTWHYARLISYKVEQDLGPASLLFSMADSNPQVLELMSGLIRPILTKNLEENGGKVLEWYPAKKASFGGRSVPVLTARLIMTEKVPLPMFATVYVFMQGDRPSGFGMFCPDSDRLFWIPLFGQMVSQMRP
jgi:hypothetical protein